MMALSRLRVQVQICIYSQQLYFIPSFISLPGSGGVLPFPLPFFFNNANCDIVHHA